MTFLIILIVPLLVAILAWILLDGISWKEFVVHVASQLIVAGVSMAIIYNMDTRDTEIWNGWVVSREQKQVSCSHSYECNCRSEESCSGSGKDRSCTSRRVCDTCYEHSYDYDWMVYTSNREDIEIDRVDRQGVNTPPRWAAVRLLEPTAVDHTYTSYIKAAPDTLFRHTEVAQKYRATIPKYPLRIYDYYHLNRLVQVGVSVKDRDVWNRGLEVLNSELGSKKQVNIIVVLTNQPQEWYYALETAWIGGEEE